MNLVRTLMLTMLLLASFIGLAQGHAFLDHAEPKVGDTVKTSPAMIRIWFTRFLARNGSKIEVFNTEKEEIDLKDVKIDTYNQTQMSVSLPKLAPGTYKVVWNAVCRDSHHTTGSFLFTVVGT